MEGGREGGREGGEDVVDKYNYVDLQYDMSFLTGKYD